MKLPSRPRSRPRSASLFAILLLTVGLAGVLTFEAWDAARSHRATAEYTSVVSRTVDTHIVELRRKLEADPAHPQHILTVRKAGYRLKR